MNDAFVQEYNVPFRQFPKFDLLFPVILQIHQVFETMPSNSI